MSAPRRIHHPQVELQIAPMIDVCFLLLFFYIITSKPIKPEADLSMTLPGTVAQEQALELPDEQRIEIRKDGSVFLNDMPVDSSTQAEMPQLVVTLRRFKEACAAYRAEALITLAVDDEARHQRIADVMNACALAGIHGVSFAVADEEE
ncbi:MAG: biopolymer transporter ExbD [Methylacidiphilales bacterium]|nr:biopolymer transporter ExbD [Candidatus Methylacidiphilales bacterium]